MKTRVYAAPVVKGLKNSTRGRRCCIRVEPMLHTVGQHNFGKAFASPVFASWSPIECRNIRHDIVYKAGQI